MVNPFPVALAGTMHFKSLPLAEDLTTAAVVPDARGARPWRQAAGAGERRDPFILA
jgi:hypothetical protein